MLLSLSMALVSALVQDKPQETRENPVYKYWSGCKVGSWVKTTMQSEQRGQTVRIDQMQKLLEVGEDKLVVEMSGTMKMAAGEFPMPAQKQEVKPRESAEKMKVDKEGDEEIEVAG
ncbi:MAG TPA: hypothetical protein VEN81_15390, partial [Planctomycetota bacterium]|nr:hypothetical protein [Planctomycetota bacterium]